MICDPAEPPQGFFELAPQLGVLLHRLDIIEELLRQFGWKLPAKRCLEFEQGFDRRHVPAVDRLVLKDVGR
jgi:hypothetical protein